MTRKKKTNYRKADWDKFTQDTEDAFTALQPPTDIHDANKTFTNILYQAGKKHIPVGRIRNTDKLLPQPRQTPTTTHMQQNCTQKLDKQKHATRSQYTGVKQRYLHPHKHKQDRNLEGTHRKTMGPQKKHKHLLEHNTRSSPQTTTTAGQQLHNIQGQHTHQPQRHCKCPQQTVHEHYSSQDQHHKQIFFRKVLSLQPTQINITTEQVLTAIKNSKNNNSTGPDNINIKHFKNMYGNWPTSYRSLYLTKTSILRRYTGLYPFYLLLQRHSRR